MNTATSTLSTLPSTKDEVYNFARKLEAELVSGEVNPLDLMRFKKAFDKLFETVKPTLDEYSREEAEKYGNNSFVYHGLKIELAENGVKFDYSKCNDPILKRMQEKYEKADIKLKDRQKFLKGIKGSIQVVDETTGEVVEVFPPIRSSISGIKCELI